MTVPESELTWSYARSSGPGGQNVNKVASKAILRWSMPESTTLPEYVKHRLTLLFPSRITESGDVLISSQEHRDRAMNRLRCLEKLQAMIEAARKLPKPRTKTKPSQASQQRRLQTKKHAAQRRGERSVRDD